jgi:glycosyltransferase involved in cell wall biosynthesis
MYIHTFDHGGIAHVAYSVAEHLAALGADVFLVGAVRLTVDTVEPSSPVRVVDLRAPARNHLFAVPRLARWMRNARPDVVFAHGNAASSTALAARFVAHVPASIVTVEHTHYSSFFSDQSGPRRHAKVRDIETAALHPFADAVAAVSDGVADDLASRFPRIRSRVVTLRNPGPDQHDVEAARAAVPDHPWFTDASRPRIVTSVALVVPRKGQDTLVQALPRIRDAAGDVRLMLVGRIADKRYARRLEQDAAGAGVAEYVSLVGYRSDPLSFIAHSDAFALASRTEAYGLVLIEAMACGVPVIATDCPVGPAEALGGDAGLLVPVDDPDAMARAIASVLVDPERRDRLVARGYERARAHDPTRAAGAYLDLALGLAGREAARP